MGMMRTVQRFCKLVVVQHRLLVGWQLLGCGLLIGSLPLIASFQAISLYQGALITETYMSLVGIILIGTILLPESNQDLLSLLHSKVVPVNLITGIRVLEAYFYVGVVMLLWSLFLHHQNAGIRVDVFFVSGFSVALLLGNLALLAALITQNTYTGLLLSFFAYIYFVFGMSPRQPGYPLTLLLDQQSLSTLTWIIILISMGLIALGLLAKRV